METNKQNQIMDALTIFDTFLVNRIYAMIQAKDFKNQELKDEKFNNVQKDMIAKYQKIKTFIQGHIHKDYNKGFMKQVIEKSQSSLNQGQQLSSYLFYYNPMFKEISKIKNLGKETQLEYQYKCIKNILKNLSESKMQSINQDLIYLEKDTNKYIRIIKNDLSKALSVAKDIFNSLQTSLSKFNLSILSNSLISIDNCSKIDQVLTQIQQKTSLAVCELVDSFSHFIQDIKKILFVNRETKNIYPHEFLTDELAQYFYLIKQAKYTQPPNIREMAYLKSNWIQLCMCILSEQRKLSYNSYNPIQEYEKYKNRKNDLIKQIKSFKDKITNLEKRIANENIKRDSMSVEDITHQFQKAALQIQIDELKKKNWSLAEQFRIYKEQNVASYDCQIIQLQSSHSQNDLKLLQLKTKLQQLQNANQQLKNLNGQLEQDKKLLMDCLQNNKSQFQGQLIQIRQQNKRHYQLLQKVIQNNVILIQINYRSSTNQEDTIEKQQFSNLVTYLERTFQYIRTKNAQIIIQKDDLHNQLTKKYQQQTIQLENKIKQLSEELCQINQLANRQKYKESNYLTEIQVFTKRNESLMTEIKTYQQSIDIQKSQIQYLQNSLNQIHVAELQRERQSRFHSLFDARGCLDNSQKVFAIKSSIVNQIERINNKKVVETRLLYQHSPQTKLQWTHFANKPQFLMLIRTENQKIIAIYSQSSIMKPPLTHDKKQDIAFIFESNLKGEFAEFYPLLQGKSINGSYGNSVAFGKSDLRFSLGDTFIEGNFGYQGTLFDTKGKKIADLLGIVGGNKVKMLSYEMYIVELGEQVQLKAQNTKRYGNAEIQLQEKKIGIQINKKYDGEYDQQKAVLSRKITELEETLKEKNKQITIKSQQCEQLKADIRLKQQNTPETQQRLLQSYTKYAEINSSLQQSYAKYTELQKQKTHLTTVFNKAQKEIERFRTLQANLNSQIAVLSAKQSNSQQLATLQKTHEQQKKNLKISNLKLQKEFAQTRKQRQQLNIKYKEISKAKQLLEMQVSDLQLKVSNLQIKIEQYQYRQQGGGHTQQILLRENCEPNEQLSQLKNQVELHRQSLRAKDNQINQLTNEVDRINTANTEMTDQNIESLNEITQLEDKISRLDHQVKQLQSDNQSLITKMTEQSIQIGKINSENEQLKNKNQSQDQKLTEAISLNEKANKQLGVNSQNLRLSQSAATQLQSYKKMAETYTFDPFLIAQYDKSFETQVLCGQLQHKITLIRHLQLRMHQTFSSARLVYRYDPHNATIYHKYIDGLDNLLCVVKTVRGVLLAGYYSGAYVQNEILNKPGCLISITNNESYDLHNEKTHPSQRAFRGMIYNEYFIIFGNAEIRIRANEKTVFSNFGIASSFFNPRNKRVHDLLGEGQNRQIEFQSYELYQVTFQKQEEQAR